MCLNRAKVLFWSLRPPDSRYSVSRAPEGMEATQGARASPHFRRTAAGSGQQQSDHVASLKTIMLIHPLLISTFSGVMSRMCTYLFILNNKLLRYSTACINPLSMPLRPDLRPEQVSAVSSYISWIL
jgi:hypothetical protein